MLGVGMKTSRQPNGPLHDFIFKMFSLLEQMLHIILALASCLLFNVLNAHMSLPSIFQSPTSVLMRNMLQ